MRRHPRHMAAPPQRRAGLALPTAVGAILCGGSVLAVAATGALALDAVDRRPVAVLAPPARMTTASPSAVPSAVPSGVATSGVATSGVATSPVASVTPPAVPPVAATAGEFAVTVQMPGETRPGGMVALPVTEPLARR